MRRSAGLYLGCTILLLNMVLGACAKARTSGTAVREEVKGETWDYVVLGSSIGTWWAKNFMSLVEADLSVKIVYHDYYVNSQTTKGLLRSLMENKVLRQDIRNAKIITVGCGFADMYMDAIVNYTSGAYDERRMEQKLKVFRETYDYILKEVFNLASSKTMIRIMDFYFPYVREHKEKGTYDATKRYWLKFNECIVRAGRRAGIPAAQVFLAYNGSSGDDDPVEKGYIAGDGRHPSDLGKETIAAEFRKLGYGYTKR